MTTRDEGNPCPPEQTLRRLLETPDDVADEWAAHIECCRLCQATLDRLTSTGDPRPLPESHRPAWPLVEQDLLRLSGLLRGDDTPASWLPPPAPVGPDLPGYDVVRELGRGGMAVVYEARQHGLDRTVAVKVIRGEASTEAVIRLGAEARVMAGLRHPNVVQVFEVGTSARHPYLVLELMAGGTLAAAVAGRPAPPRLAAATLVCLARAVHYAHQHGVLHRDIKPSNVLLDAEADGEPRADHPLAGRTVKVSDFGRARSVADVGPGPTHDGQVVGTPYYLAPEQARPTAAGVTVATDVYALGATLYEVLTGGRPPFDDPADDGATRPSTWAVLDRVVSAAPSPPSRWAPGVPAELGAVCLKCLEKSPEARYPTAAALADDLQRFLDGRPVLARPTPVWARARRWAWRHPQVAALLSLLVVTVVGGTAGSAYFAAVARGQSRRAVSEATALRVSEQARATQAVGLLLDRGVELANGGDPTTGLAWMAAALRTSPDPVSQRLARVDMTTWADRAPRLRWWLPVPFGHTSLAAGGSCLVTAGPDAAHDGLVSLQFWDLDLGRPVGPARVAPDRFIGPLAFSPDGSRLLAGNGLSQPYQGHPGWARLWDVGSGRPTGRVAAHESGVGAVAWSPDGRHFATGSGDGTVQVWSADRLTPDGPLVRTAGAPSRLVFSGNGRWVLATSATAAEVCDLARGRVVGPPLAVAGAGQYVTSATFGSGDGTVLVVVREPLAVGHLLVTRPWDSATGSAGPAAVQPYGGPAVTLLADGRVSADPSVDRDGRRIVRVDDGIQVWASPAVPISLPVPPVPTFPALTDLTVLRFGPTFDSADRYLWRPVGDGRRVEPLDPATGAVVGPALPRDPQERFRVAACGDGTRAALVVPKSADRPVAVTAQLYDPRDGRPVGPPLRMGNTIISLDFSPDGRLVATGGHDHSVCLWDARDGRPVGGPLVQDDMVNRIRFSADGRTLAVATYGSAVRLWDVAAGKLRLPPLPHDESVDDLAFNPTGDRLASSSSHSARLWDAHDGRRLAALPYPYPVAGNRAFVDQQVRFSPDGRLLMTTNGYGTAYLWDARDGHARGVLLPPADPAGTRVQHTAFAFDPTGRWLAAAYDNGTLQVWDVGTGRPWGAPAALGVCPSDVRFAADGRSVDVVAADGRVSSRPVPAPCTDPVDVLVRRAERSTGRSGDPAAPAAVLSRKRWLDGE